MDKKGKSYCRYCHGEADYGPNICEVCFAYNFPKDYCRALTRERYGKAKWCKVCRLPTGVQFHHFDYTKPYDAVPLCKDCHKIADKHRDKTDDHLLGEYWKNKVIEKRKKQNF